MTPTAKHAARRIATAIAVLIAIAAVADAARDRSATFSVEVVTSASPAWRADALSAALNADLADDQLRAPEPGKAAELVVRCDLAGDELRYAIVHGGAPIRGAVDLHGLDRHALAGVFRDQLHRLVRPDDDAARPGPPAALSAPGSLGAC